MSTHNYSNLGVSSTAEDMELKEELLACFDVDTSTTYEENYNIFNEEPPVIGACKDNNSLPVTVYTVFNKLFGKTDVYYSNEEANSTTGYLHKTEFILSDKEIKIGEHIISDDLIYHDGVSIFTLAREEFENAASSEGIEIEWVDGDEIPIDDDYLEELEAECEEEGTDFFVNYFPSEGSDFFYCCMEHLANMDLSPYETVITKEKFKEIKLTDKFITAIIKKAKANGYNDLVDLLEEKL